MFNIPTVKLKMIISTRYQRTSPHAKPLRYFFKKKMKKKKGLRENVEILICL